MSHENQMERQDDRRKYNKIFFYANPFLLTIISFLLGGLLWFMQFAIERVVTKFDSIESNIRTTTKELNNVSKELNSEVKQIATDVQQFTFEIGDVNRQLEDMKLNQKEQEKQIEKLTQETKKYFEKHIRLRNEFNRLYAQDEKKR